MLSTDLITRRLGIVNRRLDQAIIRGGVEDTRLEAKAMDTTNFEAKVKDRPSRSQGPRTQTQVFSKKKVFKIFFRRSQKKRFSKFFFRQKRSSKKFFFRRSLLEETKKRFLQIFRKVSGVF